MKVLGAVLAAGKGERMRIARPKPLVPMLGLPMIAYALDALRRAGIPSPVVIASPETREPLGRVLGKGVRFVVQPRPRGTGDAVNRLRALARGAGRLVVINADSPLFEPVHVRTLVARALSARAQVAFATAVVDDPSGLGRVLRDPDGKVANIVEDSEASPEVRRIREINAGLYAFETPAIFSLLDSVEPVGVKRELYLTRAVELALSRGLAVATAPVPAEAALGVNNLAEAALARAVLLSRKLAALMSSGVAVEDPASTHIDWEVSVGPGSVILPGTILMGRTRVGRDCVLGPHSVVTDSLLGNAVIVRSSYVTGSRMMDGSEAGPFVHVRAGCVLGRGVQLRTHAEVVRARLGDGVKMHHFSYIGDAVVGPNVNVGAGAITANYDGRKKWPSRIGRGAFLGSGSVLVAPANVGERAVIAAGAVVPGRRRVPAGAVMAGVPARPLANSRGRKRV
jgi:bifunctional UDP-N-acetylglucosamine pyrophosphorylase/glucosamine-1-phosphate N-acetyltransferase